MKFTFTKTELVIIQDLLGKEQRNLGSDHEEYNLVCNLNQDFKGALNTLKYKKEKRERRKQQQRNKTL